MILTFSRNYVPRLQKCLAVICWKSVLSSQCCNGLKTYLAHACWLFLYNSKLLQTISQNPQAPCLCSGKGWFHSACNFTILNFCCLKKYTGWVALDSDYVVWVYPGCALPGCLERDRSLKLHLELFHWLCEGDKEKFHMIKAVCDRYNLTQFHKRSEWCIGNEACF